MKATTDIIKVDGEYQVRLFEDGIRNHNATYFTDDKEDAQETAKAMVRDYKPTAESAYREELLEQIEGYCGKMENLHRLGTNELVKIRNLVRDSRKLDALIP